MKSGWEHTGVCDQTRMILMHYHHRLKLPISTHPQLLFFCCCCNAYTCKAHVLLSLSCPIPTLLRTYTMPLTLADYASNSCWLWPYSCQLLCILFSKWVNEWGSQLELYTTLTVTYCSSLAGVSGRKWPGRSCKGIYERHRLHQPIQEHARDTRYGVHLNVCLRKQQNSSCYNDNIFSSYCIFLVRVCLHVVIFIVVSLLCLSFFQLSVPVYVW